MVFFRDWLENIHDIQYLDAFLSKDPVTLSEFYDEQTDTQKNIIATLLSVEADEIIERIIERESEVVIISSQVPQFSSFEIGTKKICEILDFSPDGMSFADIGYKLCKAPNYTACIKYGENHAKLANTLHLVDICKHKGSIVRITPFGRESMRITEGKEQQLFQKLLLREDLVKVLIAKGAEGKVSYREIVNSLSEATAIRRRTNTKCFLSHAVSGTSYEYIYDNVIW